MSPAWLSTMAVAHRGLHDESIGIPENTLAAFEAAVRGGYAVELDVQPASDGTPMVFHDDRLDRLTLRWGAVADYSARELCAIEVLRSGETIPTLQQVVDRVGGRVPLLVEIKAGRRRVGPLESAVAAVLSGCRGLYAVQSFDPKIVNWFRRHQPRMPRGQIAMDFRADDELGLSGHEKWFATQMAFNTISRPDFVAYDVQALPNHATRRARAQGLPLLTWTVRTPADRLRAAAHADNIIFEGFRP